MKNSFKRWEYQIPWPASWEICMQVKKQQLKLGMEQQNGSKLERSMSRLYIVTLLIQLVCRVHHEKWRARCSTSWNQDCREKYQSPQICRWHHLYGRKWRGTQKPRATFTFTFFYALEKEMAPHSSILAWRIPGTGEPGGLPSIVLHRVGHDGSDLAAAAAAYTAN